ncbi:histidine phosphatase family protein [Rivibacter subsaxonicus]|uniref:Histidine phosphatase superfamily protein (Branch 1) n=1 Tax=Rivibacter subsaxonicus TaxID=457575 RepID=A0A4Q7VWR8_9BURK|nr:histidine phosphatase family protein [Rivibacter subsaxonicus]RZU00888.1 histidine phosphatase superfamily protein (branch 1) [Rivibacter subsaxonicus]
MSTLPALPSRRALLRALAAVVATQAPWSQAADDAPWPPAAIDALRRGGVVAAFRHANAPGTFDPPGFRLGDCSTQRNLDEAGRAQSKRLGERFARLGLQPAVVRASPWCRTLDTARLAFGQAQPWAALGSVRAAGTDEAQQLAELRAALAAVGAGRFEVWVSHQFTLTALAGEGLASGAGLLLRTGADSRPQIVARLSAD